ncbi:hypothetical protein SGL43_02817 [Streptomyces globisporus]|uniref:Uncharacterized protein n=1 Tax=Streptomyces globisporus TaxID=1908 RepID=A0ABM9GWQ5_STRGL|nr:hypothetical protein SGL43_02817 [Streptomyces globisporus]
MTGRALFPCPPGRSAGPAFSSSSDRFDGRIAHSATILRTA